MSGVVVRQNVAHYTKEISFPVLLPVGQKAQFRIQKDKMLLQVEDVDSKEREYSVVSMTPRHDK